MSVSFPTVFINYGGKTIDRREFLGWVGAGCLASSLPVAIASCASQNKTKALTNSAEFQVMAKLN